MNTEKGPAVKATPKANSQGKAGSRGQSQAREAPGSKGGTMLIL